MAVGRRVRYSAVRARRVWRRVHGAPGGSDREGTREAQGQAEASVRGEAAALEARAVEVARDAGGNGRTSRCRCDSTPRRKRRPLVRHRSHEPDPHSGFDAVDSGWRSRLASSRIATRSRNGRCRATRAASGSLGRQHYRASVGMGKRPASSRRDPWCLRRSRLGGGEGACRQRVCREPRPGHVRLLRRHGCGDRDRVASSVNQSFGVVDARSRQPAQARSASVSSNFGIVWA
jgi:hypothetical protein